MYWILSSLLLANLNRNLFHRGFFFFNILYRYSIHIHLLSFYFWTLLFHPISMFVCTYKECTSTCIYHFDAYCIFRCFSINFAVKSANTINAWIIVIVYTLLVYQPQIQHSKSFECLSSPLLCIPFRRSCVRHIWKCTYYAFHF